MLLIALAMIPLGLALKRYGGPGSWWVNNWGASVPYEVMLMGLVLATVPKLTRRLAWVAVGVCGFTIGLEFLQAWKPGPQWLEAARSTFLGRGFLGHSFSWWDLPGYPIGCAVGWLALWAAAGAVGQPEK